MNGLATRGTDLRAHVSYVAVGLTLVAVTLSLRCFGFERTVQGVRRYTRERPARREGPLVLSNVARRCAVVAALAPFRARCLEQSLTLFCLLRRAGLAAQLRLGVQASPFKAHAWVEHAGIPIAEEQEAIRSVVPFPRVIV